MKRILFSTAVALAGLTGAAWAQESVDAQVSHCAVKTHAPGSYDVVRRAAVPRVVASVGGTERGASNINDCLEDVYEVQFGASEFGGVETAAPARECRGLRRVFTSCVSDEIYADSRGLVYNCRRNSSPLIRGSSYCRR